MSDFASRGRTEHGLPCPTAAEVCDGVRDDIKFFMREWEPALMILLGATYFAPLCRVLSPQFAMLLIGDNLFTAALADLIQSHFMPLNIARESWEQSIETLWCQVALAENVVFSIDGDASKYKDAYGFMYEVWKANCVVIATSAQELGKNDLHLLSRMIVLDFNKAVLKWDWIFRARHNKKLRLAMNGYVRWLHGHAELPAELKNIKEAILKHHRAGGTSEAQLPFEGIALIGTGLEMFVRYAQAVEAVTDAEASDLRDQFQYAQSMTLTLADELAAALRMENEFSNYIQAHGIRCNR